MFQRSLLVACAAVGLVLPAASFGQLINVDFGPGATHGGAAIFGDAGDTWNNIATAGDAATATTLLDSDGNDVGVTLTITDDGTSGTFNADAAANPAALMDGIRSNNNGGGGTSFAQQTFDFDGLMANTDYDVVAYAAATPGTDRGSVFFGTLNGPALGQTTGSVVDIFAANAPGNAYTTFTVTTDATGGFTLLKNFNSGSSTQAPVNGFQVSAVPEPGSMALLLGSGVLLVVRRRNAGA